MSDTKYATMRAAGKKTKLKMKYPMKLWPFRLAIRAGQNAIAIQMTDMAASRASGAMWDRRTPEF